MIHELIRAWLRSYPLHVWALCGLIAWGWMSLWWILIWEIGGVFALAQSKGRTTA